MRVYLAAAYERQEEMRGVRDLLVAFGHEVTSTWIDRTEEPAGGIGAAHLTADPMAGTDFAHDDLQDIGTATVVLSFTGGNTRGGRHVDYGYALGRGKYTIVVGAREHIFHTLPEEWYPDWTGLMMAITGRPPRSVLYQGLPGAPQPARETPHQEPGTELIPVVMDNGAPADPGEKTQWWPFAPTDSVDARDIARDLGVPQREDN